MPSISSPSFFIKDGSKRNYFHILVVTHVSGSPQPYLPYVFQCNLAFHLRTAFSNICNLYNEREQAGHVLRTRISRFLSVWRKNASLLAAITEIRFPPWCWAARGCDIAHEFTVPAILSTHGPTCPNPLKNCIKKHYCCVTSSRMSKITSFFSCYEHMP